MVVVYKQDIGSKDNVAFKMDRILSAYCAPCADVTVVLNGDLDVMVALPTVGKPCAIPNLDTISQPNKGREPA
jgi:hypothetical protein